MWNRVAFFLLLHSLSFTSIMDFALQRRSFSYVVSLDSPFLRHLALSFLFVDLFFFASRLVVFFTLCVLSSPRLLRDFSAGSSSSLSVATFVHGWPRCCLFSRLSVSFFLSFFLTSLINVCFRLPFVVWISDFHFVSLCVSCSLVSRLRTCLLAFLPSCSLCMPLFVLPLFGIFRAGIRSELNLIQDNEQERGRCMFSP